MFATVLSALVLASPAVVAPSGEAIQPYQRWATSARVPVPARVTVSDEPCLEGVACADLESGTLHGEMTRSAFFHELGHLFDWQAMTDPDRARFAAIFHRRYDPDAYWSGAGQDRSLAEWFAEGYRLCAMYRRFRDPVLYHVDIENYLYEPSANQQRRVCALIRT